MERIGEYRGFELLGGQKQEPGKDGITYWVGVIIPNQQGIDNRLFTEIVSISFTAIVLLPKYQSNVDALEYIKKLTISRAVARIDMGMYKKETDYTYEILSNNLSQPQYNQEISDNDIIKIYLKTLANIRRSNPTKYNLDGTDLGGFCSILEIEKKHLLFIATTLEEDGLVQSGKTREAAIQIGGGHITADGIRFLNKLEADYQKPERIVSIRREEKIMGKRVFIIHGHDNELKTQVQLTLTRAKLEEIVLHECPDKGRTIIDKLEQESDGACYAIALLSPDDELTDGKLRARQNVILEIGYFIGKLGKERVRLLKRGNVEIPSDLQGILYTTYDENGAWKISLLKEMQAVGIELEIDKVIAKY